MKTLNYCLIILFIHGCASQPADKSGNQQLPGKTIQEKLLIQAANDIIQRMSFVDQRNYDYTPEPEKKNDIAKLRIKVHKSSWSSADLVITSYSDSRAVIESVWHSSEEKIFSVILKKNEDDWENITKNSYLTGQVEKIIDLDGNGSDELIIRSSTRNTDKGYTVGKYRLAYLNNKGKYEEYYWMNFGSFFKHTSGIKEDERDVTLNYYTTQNGISVEAIIRSGQGVEINRGSFLWDGHKLEQIKESPILVIKGKDIWVRDEPSTGKVVMKLNNGDRCKLLYTGQFEIIRGMPDYWYKIEFDGKTGWMFGSQTNIKYYESTISTGQEVWDAFREALKKQYLAAEKEGYFSDEYAGGEYNENSKNSFSIKYYNEDGFIANDYCLGAIEKNDIVLISHTREVGAAMLCYYYSTKAAIFKNSQWHLKDEDAMEGSYDTLVGLSDEEIMIFTKSGDNCGTPFGFMGFNYESCLNIYLFNRNADKSFQKIQELGKIVRDESELYELPDGSMITDSKTFDYSFKPDNISLTINELKVMKKGEDFERVKDSTETTTYRWDDQKRQFLKL